LKFFLKRPSSRILMQNKIKNARRPQKIRAFQPHGAKKPFLPGSGESDQRLEKRKPKPTAPQAGEAPAAAPPLAPDGPEERSSRLRRLWDK
jgi:hypothetical protein